MNYSLKVISIILTGIMLFSCTKKDSIIEVEDIRHLSPKKIELKPSLKACYSNCFKEYCSKIKSSHAKWVDNKSISAFTNTVKNLLDKTVNYDCSKYCSNEDTSNPIKICEKANPSSVENLDNNVFDMILTHDSKRLKLLRMSEELAAFKNKKFLDYQKRIKSSFKKIDLPPIFSTQDENGRGPDEPLIYWLINDDLSCLTPSLNSEIEKMKASASLKEASEYLILDISTLREKLFIACKLNELRIYTREKSILQLPKSPPKLTYVYTAPNSRPDCPYSNPRIEVEYSTKINGALFIHKNYRPFRQPKDIEMLGLLNKNLTDFNPHSQNGIEDSANLENSAFRDGLIYKDNRIVLKSFMDYGGMNYQIYHLIDEGLIYYRSAFSEACI